MSYIFFHIYHMLLPLEFYSIMDCSFGLNSLLVLYFLDSFFPYFRHKVRQKNVHVLNLVVVFKENLIPCAILPENFIDKIQ